MSQVIKLRLSGAWQSPLATKAWSGSAWTTLLRTVAWSGSAWIPGTTASQPAAVTISTNAPSAGA